MEAPHAMASSVETAQHGFPSAIAMPFTLETPMRTPVKEPGPAVTAKRSTSSNAVRVQASSCSTMGMSVWLCVRAVLQ